MLASEKPHREARWSWQVSTKKEGKMYAEVANIFGQTQPIYDPCQGSCYCIDYFSFDLVSGS